MSELKRNEVLSFDDGVLTIKMSGHGRANGWATLAFNEQQFELNDEGYQIVEIPPSELYELRDFLNRVLTERPGDQPAPSSPALDPVTVEALCEIIACKIYPSFDWKGEFSNAGRAQRTIPKMQIFEAAKAIRALIGQPAPSSTVGEAWSCGTCGDKDVPEKFRVFGSCYRCASQRSIDKRNRKINQLKASLEATLTPRSVEAPVAREIECVLNSLMHATLDHPGQDRQTRKDLRAAFKETIEPLYASQPPPDTAVRVDGLTQKQVDDAVAMIKIMASTPPKDWLLRSEIHENLADYRAALPPDAGSRK